MEFWLCTTAGDFFANVPCISFLFATLQFLDVSENELESLPVSFRGLFHLKHLLASRNSLLSLPEHLGDLTNLERLNVTTNYLESLPNSLERCTKLEELHVSGNCLQNVDLSQLAICITNETKQEEMLRKVEFFF